ncbi:hypothetical protein LDJ90_02670 [Fusobacterium vincentii]|jgi:hypothetical protein|uniref:hypothetical protein n=1 Tax=Fusobacterium TaxID=848 RepID=UPI000B92C7E9|nr:MULTISPECIES: hypothetical protein [Fusobacterium]ASS39564.1 hypothetical protein AXF16_05600 [Fusobacterium sp. oral taxon 203]ATV06027.1 hypothetical protein CS401_04100 [Fusobacterium vincentii]
MSSINELKEKELGVESITVYMFCKEENSNNGANKRELKILKNINPDEREFIQNIKNVIGDISKKVTKMYDFHKTEDEIFEIDLKDLENDKNLKYIQERLENHHNNKNKIVLCKEYPKNISFLILEINIKVEISGIEDYEKIYLYKKYDYSTLLKKNKFAFIGKKAGNEFKVEKITDGKILILDISPDCISYSDKLYVLKSVNGIFDFSKLFENVINTNMDDIEKIFDTSNSKIFNTKDERIYMGRGIKIGGFEKFKKLSSEDQKEKLKKAVEKYNEKNGSDEKLEYCNDGRIDCSKLRNSHFRIELIKCMTNKAALKFLDEELTTSTD